MAQGSGAASRSAVTQNAAVRPLRSNRWRQPRGWVTLGQGDRVLAEPSHAWVLSVTHRDSRNGQRPLKYPKRVYDEYHKVSQDPESGDAGEGLAIAHYRIFSPILAAGPADRWQGINASGA